VVGLDTADGCPELVNAVIVLHERKRLAEKFKKP
jgi:hypothetical protein